MTTFGKISAAMIVIMGMGLCAALIIFKPRATKAPPPRVLDAVEAITIKRQDYQVQLPSQGILEPVTETSVSAEVAGKVLKVSPKFEVGEAFAAGEVLLEIDPSDYQAIVSQSEASLAEAKVALEMEEARAIQAEKDWEKLGEGAEPTNLVLRKPQMESARARIDAAQAVLEKARRDLERSVIRAPYACRVRAKHTDIGSYLAPGAPIAELYRIDALEVRLPLALDDYGFLASDTGAAVSFEAKVGTYKLEWNGVVVRSEGEVERTSRSVFLVARIDPDKLEPPVSRFVAPGLFVKAAVSGVTLENVVKVPREAVYGTDQVLTISGDNNRVSYRPVTIVRTEQHHVFITDGVEEGERICITALDTVVDQMSVQVETLDGVPTSRNASRGAGDQTLKELESPM